MSADLVPHGDKSGQLYGDLPAKVKGKRRKFPFYGNWKGYSKIAMVVLFSKLHLCLIVTVKLSFYK